MERFKEYYPRPFKNDKGYTKVFSNDNSMAFDFPFKLIYSEGYHFTSAQMTKIIKVLNSDENYVIPYELQYSPDDSTIYINKDEHWKEFIIIRGWGKLTGTGGFNLHPDKAAKIQDAFANWIISKLQ